MIWRTWLSASGAVAHGFDRGVSLCGHVSSYDCRDVAKGDRRCKVCERVVARWADAEKAKQRRLPL